LDVPRPKNFRWKLWTAWTALGNRSEPLLHLVDASGHELEGDLRRAVHSAYSQVLRVFRKRVDEATLANMAEEVAVSVAAKRNRVQAIRPYTLAALTGKVLDWLRIQPRVELSANQLSELGDASHAAEDPAFAEVEIQRLLDELRAQLTERDRLILFLMIRDQGDPRNVAAALHLSYDAAAKAIQRTRARIAEILSEGRRNNRQRSRREMMR
jgi:DNA-directed RNA polymerase specialized sigma24 family protein